MAEKDVKITSLELELGKKKVSLTIGEARKLKNALDELFATKVIHEEHHHHDYPNYWWYKPSRNPFYVTCENNGGEVFTTSGVTITNTSTDCGSLKLTI